MFVLLDDLAMQLDLALSWDLAISNGLVLSSDLVIISFEQIMSIHLILVLSRERDVYIWTLLYISYNDSYNILFSMSDSI